MKPLFILRNIAAINFYLYAQDFPLDALGNTVFLGGNGSGKSVLLDAIQIVMTGMNRRYLDLNSRVSEGGKNTRTVREACLGLLDDGQRFQRQSCITYIALGFESSDGKRRCTAGICLEAKVSLNDETVLGLFLVDNVILRFPDFVHPREKGFEEKAWHSFLDEQRRKGHTLYTFTRQNNKAFLRQLYSIINANVRGTQLDPDRARAAMRQALSFDIAQITSVTDFVKKFLLDEAPIEIHTFQARYATWRGLQKDIARVEADIRQVEAIRLLCDRVMEEQFNSHLWEYGRQRAEYDRLTLTISQQAQEKLDKQKTLGSIEAYKRTVSAQIEEARLHLQAVDKQISGTPGYEQIKQAETEQDRHEAIRKAASIEAKVIFDALTALREAGASDYFSSNAFPAFTAFIKARLSRFHVGNYDLNWPAVPREIADIVSSIPTLSNLLAAVERAYQGAAAEHARITNEGQEIERHLSNLRSGGTFISRDTQNFLADMARINIPAKSLSELADIAPAFAEWRGIIEAILGDWCDAVIIEPRFMDHAYGHFDRHYKGTHAKLVQSENTSSKDQESRTGTLAEAVVTNNGHARAFINVRLGRILRARSARDIRVGELAASTDGKYAHGRGIEYRRLQSIPRLGNSVREQQISQLLEDQKRLNPQLHIARQAETRLLTLVTALKRAESDLIIDKENALATLQKISNADAEISRQAELISRLKSALPPDLLKEKQKLEADLANWRTELIEEGKRENKLRHDLGVLDGNMSTTLEGRKSAARQALHAIPPVEQRVPKHDSPKGLECFVRRARRIYRELRSRQADFTQIRHHFENLLTERKQSAGTTMRLATSVSNYVQANPDQHPGFEWTTIIQSEHTVNLYDWISLRHHHLTETILRNFKAQVDKAVVALVETMVHDFLSRLRASIDAVERVKDDLNRSLRGSVFMGEVYQIRQERDQDKEAIRYLIDRLDIVAPKATALMQSDTDPNDPDQVKIKQLIETLTLEGGDEAAHRRHLNELADYRNYFRFSIDICDPSNAYRKISDLEQRRGKASGGQKFVPFYICLGVAAASAYYNHLGDSKDAPPQSALLLMDEAFEKLDPENIYKIIDFYKSLGLQLVMAAPKTHQALYQETFNTLISIVRVGRSITATPQHFKPAAQALLIAENPMHRPRSYFEELAKGQHAGK
jgi:Putative exonuclease SbcCD, C subunit/P-loop containing region of AAA domain